MSGPGRSYDYYAGARALSQHTSAVYLTRSRVVVHDSSCTLITHLVAGIIGDRADCIRVCPTAESTADAVRFSVESPMVVATRQSIHRSQ